MKSTYTHPEGFAIRYDASRNRLIAENDDGATIAVPIGPAGLRQLAKALEQAAREHATANAATYRIDDAMREIYRAEARSEAEHALRLAIADVLTAEPTRETAADALAHAVLDIVIDGMAAQPFTGSAPGSLLQDAGELLARRNADAMYRAAPVPF